MKRALTIIAVTLAGCSETGRTTPPPRAKLNTALTVASQSGCRLDDDCLDGTFCFQSACVAECRADSECPSGATCSTRSRCVFDSDVDAGLDAQAIAEDLGGITITGWPEDNVLRVGPTAPFVELTLTTSSPVPGGRLLYSMQLQQGARTVARAEGSTTFTLSIPTGTAGSDAPGTQVLELVTPMERRTLFLVPARPRSGRYVGTFTPPVFGGAGLPFEFALETEPANVFSLAEAQRAWLWLPATPDALVSLASNDSSTTWVRRPLTWDADIDAWVALFA
ncbi:MAG: dickkopf-related protein, partial [Archangium sp.]